MTIPIPVSENFRILAHVDGTFTIEHYDGKNWTFQAMAHHIKSAVALSEAFATAKAKFDTMRHSSQSPL